MTVAPGTNVIATSISGQVSVASSKISNQVAIIDNVLEGVKGSVSLPAETESMAVTPEGKFAFAAVHNTNSIEILDLSNSALCTTLTTTCRGPITVSAPTKIVLSGDGKTLLAFSSDPNTGNSSANINTVAIIDVATATSTTGPGTPKFVGGFDHAVTAVFNTDNVNAFVMNCGSECGGGTPGVQILNTAGSGSLGAAVTGVPATVGALDSGNLYVAGTAAQGAMNGGKVTKLNASTLATIGTPASIAPGIHDTMVVQAGKAFVGSRACTLAPPPPPALPPPNQPCLAIFDGTNAVLTGIAGDVTGMQAITDRSMVYVIIGGELQIYDANTSALQTQQLDIVGHAEQVVLVDP